MSKYVSDKYVQITFLYLIFGYVLSFISRGRLVAIRDTNILFCLRSALGSSD